MKPSIANANPRTFFQLEIDPETKEHLKALASFNSISASAVVRMLINQQFASMTYVAGNGHEPAPCVEEEK